MAFLRNTPSALAKMHAFPKFASLANFYALPPTTVDAEESEFSHYMFSENESLTFMTFEALVDIPDMTLLTTGTSTDGSGGVFYTFNAGKTRLASLTDIQRFAIARSVQLDKGTPISPTFSDQGVEKEALVRKNGLHFDAPLWFDPKWATVVETGWRTHNEKAQKAYFMRREPYGPIVQRAEPRERYLKEVEGEGIAIEECLYKHWQSEKYKCELHLILIYSRFEILIQGSYS